MRHHERTLAICLLALLALLADGGIRLTARRTSKDGSHWSDPPLIVMSPDWRDPAAAVKTRFLFRRAFLYGMAWRE